MAELMLKVVPRGNTVGQLVRPVQCEAEAPVDTRSPKPVALQVLALGGVLFVTAALILLLLLLNDPSAAAAFIGAGLLVCVFVLVLCASSMLGLGMGPAQLLAGFGAVARAIKNSTSKPTRQTPATTPSAATGGDTHAGA